MLTAVVTQSGESYTVHLVNTASAHTAAQQRASGRSSVATEDTVVEEDAAHSTAEGEHSAEEVDPGPSPIMPELKELAWGAGSFVVFALLMRYFLFPRLKKGMDARYAGIQADHESADAARAAARTEVADYESQLAGVKAEAAAIVDGARQTLEGERSARLATVNEGIAARRGVAVAEAEAARAAVMGQVESAVADVSARAIELAVGKRPDASLVNRVVGEVINAGASR